MAEKRLKTLREGAFFQTLYGQYGIKSQYCAQFMYQVIKAGDNPKKTTETYIQWEPLCFNLANGSYLHLPNNEEELIGEVSLEKLVDPVPEPLLLEEVPAGSLFKYAANYVQKGKKRHYKDILFKTKYPDAYIVASTGAYAHVRSKDGKKKVAKFNTYQNATVQKKQEDALALLQKLDLFTEISSHENQFFVRTQIPLSKETQKGLLMILRRIMREGIDIRFL